MKKRIGIALTTITASTLCLQPVMVMAKTDVQPIVENETVRIILSAKDFYEVFLCTKTYNEKKEEVYTLFKDVTEENADVLVGAKTFYDSLTPAVGEYYIIEDKGIKVQSNVLKAEIDEMIKKLEKENPTFNFLKMTEAAKVIVDARIAEEKAAEENKTEENETEENKEVQDSKEEGDENTEAKSKEDTKEESKEVKGKEQPKANLVEAIRVEKHPVSQKKDNVVPEVITPAIPETGALEDSLEIKQEETIAVETMNEKAPVEVKEIEIPTVAKPAETVMLSNPVVYKTDAQKKAENFVASYLTSSQGSVYTQANSSNCQSIINSLVEWNKLSATEKSEVNKILQSKVGKTYQTLLKEAQAVRYGSGIQQPIKGTTYIPTNTANQTYAGFYALLCGAMAVLTGLFFRKRNEA